MYLISDKLLSLAQKNSYIDPSMYEKYDVKRGLRNSNGTGVIVGLTNIATVEGYRVEEGRKIGVEGELYYRGISLTEICKNIERENRFGFEETIFLLLFGVLPNALELQEFDKLLKESRKFPKDFVQDAIIKIPSINIMNKLERAVLISYSYDEEAEDISVKNTIRQSIGLIAHMPMLIAYAYQTMKHRFYDKSLVIHKPKDDMSIAETMLHLIRDDGKFTDLEAKLLDLCLVVHADHGGGNNSAFATHVVSSTGTDFYSALATALGSLKGPKHGGANHKVMGMIDNIKDNCDYKDTKSLEGYIRKILNKETFDKKGLVYGMGHAVYTLSDPRTVILKEKAYALAKVKGCEEEFMLYENIEEIVKRIFKEERGIDIAANVDLYSGFVYKLLGISEDLYTSIFALARVAGWCAHRLEQIQDEKIIRPAYISSNEHKHYIPISER